jgi:hypothetical protein
MDLLEIIGDHVIALIYQRGHIKGSRDQRRLVFRRHGEQTIVCLDHLLDGVSVAALEGPALGVGHASQV